MAPTQGKLWICILLFKWSLLTLLDINIISKTVPIKIGYDQQGIAFSLQDFFFFLPPTTNRKLTTVIPLKQCSLPLSTLLAFISQAFDLN